MQYQSNSNKFDISFAIIIKLSYYYKKNIVNLVILYQLWCIVMNKTVELVKLWGEFEANHPDAEIDDFCRYHLSANREKINSRELFDGFTPPFNHITLIKLIAWITRLYYVYADMALPMLRLKSMEEFYLLNAVSILKDPKKTEAINYSFQELSTGLNLLSCLRSREYITEYEDQHDKRSKRVTITDTGREVLNECYTQLRKVSEIIFNDMAEEDIELCIQLLKNIEIKFSSLWLQHKGAPLNEVYNEVTGK